jgi:hypothetical protein
MIVPKRYLLKNQNASAAHRRLEDHGWTYLDLIYLDKGRTRVTLHQSKKNKNHFALIIDASWQEFGFLDLYSNDENDALEVEKYVDFFTEEEVISRIETKVFKLIEKQYKLSLVASSVSILDLDWKFEFLKTNLLEGSPSIKSTVLEVLPLTQNERYFELLKLEFDDLEMKQKAEKILEKVAKQDWVINFDKCLFMNKIKLVNTHKLASRFLLKPTINVDGILEILEKSDWEFMYTHIDNTILTRLFLSNEKYTNYIKWTEDRDMKLMYLDFYTDDLASITAISNQLDFYTDEELQQQIQDSKTKDAIISTLTLVGLSAAANQISWKYDYLKSKVFDEDKDIKRASVFGTTLSTIEQYFDIIETGIKDKDINEYSTKMLEIAKKHITIKP